MLRISPHGPCPFRKSYPAGPPNQSGYVTGSLRSLEKRLPRRNVKPRNLDESSTSKELVAKIRYAAALEHAAASNTNPSLVEAQKLLIRMGYDVGSADGKTGPNTKAALQSYAKQVGLPFDGTSFDVLLGSLRLRQTD